MTCCRSTWTSYLIYLPHTHNSGANFFPPQLCAIKDLTPKNRRDEVRWQECENWGLDIEEEVRKMREEGCEGAGRSGSQREARLEASLFFFRLLQRDNDQTLRGRVCSRYSHLCFFIYLFILLWLNVPTIPCHFLKASHAWKLGLDCWLKEGDETKARRFVMGWWGGAELGCFFHLQGLEWIQTLLIRGQGWG